MSKPTLRGRRPVPVLWRAVSVVALSMTSDRLVAVADRGGVIPAVDRRDVRVPTFDKLDVTKRGLIVGALGATALRDAGVDSL
jgi:hypothetical protein